MLSFEIVSKGLIKKILQASTITAVISLISIAPALAEYNSGKLAQAIGGYLIANDMFEKLSGSRCGYAVKKSYSFDVALNETIIYLNKQDKRELLSFLNSEKFKKDLAENDEYIRGFMHETMKGGLDEKTACGMLISSIAIVHGRASQQWRHAKEFYTK